jgi:hypothetical protein
VTLLALGPAELVAGGDVDGVITSVAIDAGQLVVTVETADDLLVVRIPAEAVDRRLPPLPKGRAA